MCPIPPTAMYDSIAKDPQVPQQVREAALGQLNQATFQDIVSQAAITVDKPSIGNSDFTCTIYNLENKAFWELLKLKPGAPVDNPNAVTSLPGIKVQDTQGFIAKNPDGSVVTDPARQMTFDGFRATHNFYKTAFNRNSIDNQGMEIRATIHISRGYDNASWDRNKKQMVFGDGGRFDGRGWLMPSPQELADPKLREERDFDNLSNWLANYSLDVIGHELTHGVVQHTANLGVEQKKNKQWAAYSEAGTLNEHIADCFGIMLKHFVNNHTADTGSWDLSPGRWSQIAMKYQGWTDNYLRTFKIPKDKSKSPDSDPKHWNDRKSFDTGVGDGEKGLDPHVNCGIANHAFYRAALAFKGYTWQTVGKIWYDALIDKDFALLENQTFQGWKRLTMRYAEQHFGSKGKTNMENAWKQVGL